MRIRALHPGDMMAVLALAKAMHAESSYAEIPFRSERVLTLLRECLDDERYHCVVAEHEAHVVGAMVAVVGQHFFSDAFYCADLAVYVRPELRGSSAGLRLVHAIERWAKEQGCHEIRCGVTTGMDEVKATRFYNGMGYHWSGHIYCKVLSPLRDEGGKTTVLP